MQLLFFMITKVSSAKGNEGKLIYTRKSILQQLEKGSRAFTHKRRLFYSGNSKATRRAEFEQGTAFWVVWLD